MSENTAAAAPATTAAAPKKSKQVSTTVSAELFDALEDHRWTARKKMPEVIAEAVADYVAKHGIKVAGSAAPTTPANGK